MKYLGDKNSPNSFIQICKLRIYYVTALAVGG